MNGLFFLHSQDTAHTFKESKKGTKAATHITSTVKSKESINESLLACLIV